MVTRSIERAQRQVEAQNFGVRKHLLEYDDVMNKQRKAVYDMRRMVLEGKDTREHVMRLVDEIVEWYLDSYCPEKRRPEQLEPRGPAGRAQGDLRPGRAARRAREAAARRDDRRRWRARIRDRYDEKRARDRPGAACSSTSACSCCRSWTQQWKDHLYSLDHLKEGIGLRGYGQRDPLVEYKKESFRCSRTLMDRIDEEILRWIFLYQPVRERRSGRRGGRRRRRRPAPARRRAAAASPRSRAARAGAGPGRARDRCRATSPSTTRARRRRRSPKAEPREAQGGSDEVQTVKREGPKVGRNDPCPCGSGKKYKKCHGS